MLIPPRFPRFGSPLDQPQAIGRRAIPRSTHTRHISYGTHTHMLPGEQSPNTGQHGGTFPTPDRKKKLLDTIRVYRNGTSEQEKNGGLIN